MEIRLPYLIAINLTYRCNLFCEHCYLDAAEKNAPHRHELKTGELIQLFKEIAAKAPETLLVLTGGEPLLRSDIFELIEAGSSEGLKMVLGTNGTTIDAQCAEKLAASGLEGVGISLENTIAWEHDQFRGKDGAWLNSKQAVSFCKAAGLHVQLHTTVTKKNRNHLKQMVLFAKENGVNLLNFFFLVCTGRGEYLNDLTPDQYEVTLQEIAELQSTTKGLMVQARCAPHFKRVLYQRDPDSQYTKAQGYDGGGCLAATHYCRIDPVGNVTPCPYMEAQAGNIREESFWDIWENSDLFHRLIEPKLEGRCGDCEFDQLCGGCRARSATILDEDPTCNWQPQNGAPIRFNLPVSDPSNEVQWTPDAKQRLKKIPLFIRGMIRKRLEAAAKEQGVTISADFMAEHRQKRELELGMKFRE